MLSYDLIVMPYCRWVLILRALNLAPRPGTERNSRYTSYDLIVTLVLMPLFHPRNRHTGSYDFERLYAARPELKQYTRLNPAGHYTIDFANPTAVKLLNAAILATDYGIVSWDIPDNYLCPPIPGRADYIHVVADLLAASHQGSIPTGPSIRILDIGVGANTIYPLLGQAEYQWSFVGADIDKKAIAAAQKTINDNHLQDSIQLRHQPNPQHIFQQVALPEERFALSMCNPPFFNSAEQAQQQNHRKWKGLGKQNKQRNFGGQSNELWCEGGELAFISRMIQQSTHFQQQIACFTTLVSRESILPALYKQLKTVRARDVQTVEMAQGQKKSRCIAWRF